MRQVENRAVLETFHDNWWDFVRSVQSKPHTLFRGHSNFNMDQKGAEIVGEWKIKSSFNRSFPSSFFDFQQYCFKQWSQYKSLYTKDNLILQKFEEESFIDTLQFFQHYGIPTPLIDFTRNPLTALYFAITGIQHIGGRRENDELRNRNITIIEIDANSLNQNFNIRVVDGEEISIDNLDEYKVRSLATAFSIPNPRSIQNENMKRQEGCFIYLDSSRSLEDVCEDFMISNNVDESTPPPIIKHHIPYHTVLRTLYSDPYEVKPNKPNIYCFLMKQEKLGHNLFNDLQGLKYDLMVPDILSSLNCFSKADCNCAKILNDYKLI